MQDRGFTVNQRFLISSWVDSCVKGFELSGWDISSLYQHGQLSPDTADTHCCSLTYANTLFSSATELYGPAAGLKARLGISPNSFHSLSLAVLASENLLKGLSLMVKHNPQLTDAINYFCAETKEHFIFGFEPTTDIHPALADAILCTTIKTCRFVHPCAADIRQVVMARPTPDHIGEYQKYFKAPISWNGNRYEIHLGKEYVLKPSIHANPFLAEQHERLWEMYCDKVHARSVTSHIKTRLRECLEDGEVTMEKVAGSLHMGVRSLQRILSQEGTSYHELLSEVRKQQAQHYLKHSSLSITHIAQNLGYTDSGNFCRAFKRWFDCSPDSYRRACC